MAPIFTKMAKIPVPEIMAMATYGNVVFKANKSDISRGAVAKVGGNA